MLIDILPLKEQSYSRDNRLVLD